MLFDLAALWLIVWMFKNAAMDVACAVTGKPNPRYELKKAKARAAGQAEPAQPRYGTRDWFGDLLADGLRAQTDWRRHRAAERRDRAAVRRQAAEQAERDQAEQDYWADLDRTKPDRTDPERTRPALPDEPTSEPVPASAWPQQTSGPDAGGASGPEYDQQVPRQPQPPADPEPMARVYPFPIPTPQQEDPVTIVNSEIVGLDQSIAYAKSLAGFAGEHGQAGNEGYIGHLVKSKVTGAGLQSAHDMQDAFSTAQAAADKHAKELERQRSVQEAYDSTPDAGDKDFQQQGR